MLEEPIKTGTFGSFRMPLAGGDEASDADVGSDS